MSEKVYYRDNLLKKLKSNVISVEKEKDYFKVILDKTIFYPEGGGQLADHGLINGKKVFDVQLIDGKIVHFLKENLDKKEVDLLLDFERRFDLMQQHTGQHLLSEVLMKLYNVQTLSFHMGDEYSTIEISLDSIDTDKLNEIENEVTNKIIENLNIKTYIVDNVNDVPFRKTPKVKTNIRVVEIEKYDYNACGGIHVNSTGQIGILKIIKTDKIRGNVRLFFVCGKRALEDYRKKQNHISNLMRELSAAPNEIVSIIDKLKFENVKLKKDLSFLKEEYLNKKQNEIFKLKSKNICMYFKGFEIKDLRDLANKATKKNKNVIFYSDKYAVISSFEPNDNYDYNVNMIFKLFNGKGGGNTNLKQGKIESLKNIKKIIEVWESMF